MSKRTHTRTDLSGGKSQEELAAFVRSLYEARREERNGYELQWQLNMNFVMGNQYCGISPRGEIAEDDKLFFWQEREVYNHIAPILETRLAKLSRVRPRMSVVPSSGDDADVMTAKTATAVLENVTERLRFDTLLSHATMWSETCGTVFYKITWEQDDVHISVVPPFELLPDSDCAENLEGCRWLIHARAYPVEEVRDMYGLDDIEGEDVHLFSLDSVRNIGGLGYAATARKAGGSVKHDHLTVLEYYERPSAAYPSGRLMIVCGDRLVHVGEMPYRNGKEGSRGFPFVRQTAVEQAGSFWGACVIERSIPIQRAYNAVKNRKHEFLNRLAMGVLTVEDGSVDMDNLSEEGLSPGKILVYRQGANPPSFMDTGRIPNEFGYEEDKLLSEFIAVSGVSELMRSSTTNHSVNSGVALQLLIEQDDTRLAVTAELVKSAIREIAAHVLRLYKENADTKRVARIVGMDGEIEEYYWSKSDITSDDVTFISENQLSQTPAQRQNFVFDLLKTGLLTDENGKISNRMRAKLLDILDFGVWQSAKDIESLQMKSAQEENLALPSVPHIREIDDHTLHIDEHVKFMLGGEFKHLIKKHNDAERIMTEHIRQHRAALTAMEQTAKESEDE